MGLMQTLLQVVYPPHCLNCAEIVDDVDGLCPTCWRDTPFVAGLVCDLCGAPLPGEDSGSPVHCDDCRTHARPWSQGRAALVYDGVGRRLVLALKHSDRTDLAEPGARWMAQAGRSLLAEGTVLVPMPLHWRRLAQRRFNQAALLSHALARHTGLEHQPDLLRRTRATPPQKGRGLDARYRNVEGAFRIPNRHVAKIAGRPVLLIDDVMTTGASLAAAAEVCLRAGAAELRVLCLARATRDD